MNTTSDDIVIQWKSSGGIQPEDSDLADLTVFTNGCVKVGPRFANGTLSEQQLSADDLAALCRFVFEEQDIWSIDSATLEREIKAASGSSSTTGSTVSSVQPVGTEAIADAATTVIQVRAGARQHEVRQYNLFSASRRYPQLNALQRLRAIEVRLLELAQQVAASAR